MKSFRKYLIDLNEDILNHSFTKNRIMYSTSMYNNRIVIVKYNGNKLNNKNTEQYLQIREREVQNKISYFTIYNMSYSVSSFNGSYSTYDYDHIHFNETEPDSNIELYDVLILDDCMAKSNSSYTLVCFNNFFGKKVYIKSGFKTYYNIETPKNSFKFYKLVNKDKDFGYDYTHNDINKDDIFKSLYYYHKNDGIIMSLFNVIHDGASSNIGNRRYNSYPYDKNASKEEQYIISVKRKNALNVPNVFCRIKIGEAYFTLTTPFDIFNVLKRIKNVNKETKIIYDTFMTLFTRFDKMNRHQKALAKRILGKEYNRISVPIIDNSSVTVRMTTPIAFSRRYNKRYYRYGCTYLPQTPKEFINCGFNVTKHKKNVDNTELELVFDTLTEATFRLEDYAKVNGFKTLEFEHGYVVIDKQDAHKPDSYKYDTYFVKTNCGLAKVNYNWVDHVSDNHATIVKKLNLLINEYQKKLTTMIKLSGRTKSELLFPCEN